MLLSAHREREPHSADLRHGHSRSERDRDRESASVSHRERDIERDRGHGSHSTVDKEFTLARGLTSCGTAFRRARSVVLLLVVAGKEAVPRDYGKDL